MDVLDGKRWRVECAHVLTWLRSLPSCAVNVVVTSPPYFQLRDYGYEGQLGLESTPAEFVAKQVEVFAEVRRVLRNDGICFVNIGDSYAASGRGGNPEESPYRKQATNRGSLVAGSRPPVGLKALDLHGVPWMLATALRDDGWYLREDIIWAKKSPMPESINGWRWERCRVKTKAGESPARNGKPQLRRIDENPDLPKVASAFPANAEWTDCPGCDKCTPNGGYVLRRGSWRHTRAHEYLFTLTKTGDYFCDAQAIAEKAEAFLARGIGVTAGGSKSQAKNAGEDRGNSAYKSKIGNVVESRNPRSVRHLATEPSKEKHFASFPTELVRPLLLVATSEKGHCVECGAPVVRMIRKQRIPTRPAIDNKIWKATEGDRLGQRSEVSPNLDPERHIQVTETIGWKPACSCNAGTQPALAMDPYCGTGTVGVVAMRLGLRFIGCDLSAEYCEIARRRIRDDAPLLNAS